MKLGKLLIAAALGGLLLVILALWLRPPELLRVGAAYAAKIVCSNVFLAGREADEVLRSDVQAPGVALLRLMRVSVDRQDRVVRAGLLGFIGGGIAVARPGVGCAAVPDGDLAHATRVAGVALDADTPIPADAPWPDGNTVTTRPELDRLLADERLAGPGMRAIVVVDHGRIVAERYGPGFSATTPLLGWSMTKSVVAGLVGLLVQEGRLSLDRHFQGKIRLSHLLAMSSGLRFNEDYGTLSDIVRMLYLQPDMAAFARAQPIDHPPGGYWSYSSGTANIVSRIVQDAAGPLGAALPRRVLFERLGMRSGTLETDEHGTLVGSSYMYATARDWARYGQFLVQDGVWQGQRLLPEGFVAMMATPVAASGGRYGQGFVWLWGSDGVTPGVNPDAAFGIPADTFWMMGHDGQSTAIIRSRQLVVVRMGLTPAGDNYTSQPLLHAILAATGNDG
jgi:CubicO group peptidase (beta-lactamase class C family)